MRKFLFILILSSLSCILQAQHRQLEINEKTTLLDYKMKDISEKMLSLNEIKKENGLLVIFSCNTCPFVLAWEDRYPLIGQWAEENKVGLVLVNSNYQKRAGDDSFEAMQIHAKDKNYNCYYTVDHESQLANAWGAQTTPHVFLFDKTFQLVYKGAIDDNFRSATEVKEHYLKNALANLGAGKEIQVKETPPKGCSIKRK